MWMFLSVMLSFVFSEAISGEVFVGPTLGLDLVNDTRSPIWVETSISNKW